ncbi:hypothetical protein CYMTET_14612 [Cymbomonas tetramitiformis]|uniref:Esterase n=1 Tax=Cymbomonas tetramitiformis TaxID=36881 RepID=A0AAE0GFZ8_9CHLO|nr:hypothetical protein CYMTET_14612 [Cymbomonas tetramitiformis]
MFVERWTSTSVGMVSTVVLATTWALWTRYWKRYAQRSLEVSGPLMFRETETHVYRTLAGIQYQAQISLPLSYHSSGQTSYPILVVLDAEPCLFSLFAINARYLAYAQEGSFPEVIVVGLGYSDTLPEGSDTTQQQSALEHWQGLRPLRARDFLPTAADSPYGAEPLKHVSGHAEEFFDFIENQLLLDLTKRYRIGDIRCLAGLSLSGVGVTHALMRDTTTFTHYAIGSPSLWWDGEVMLKRATDWVQSDDIHKVAAKVSSAVLLVR